MLDMARNKACSELRDYSEEIDKQILSYRKKYRKVESNRMSTRKYLSKPIQIGNVMMHYKVFFFVGQRGHLFL